MSTSSFAQWSQDHPPTKTSSRCAIGRLLDDLTADESANFQQLLDAKGRSHVELVSAIQAVAQRQWSAQTVGMHRRSSCTCFETRS